MLLTEIREHLTINDIPNQAIFNAVCDKLIELGAEQNSVTWKEYCNNPSLNTIVIYDSLVLRCWTNDYRLKMIGDCTSIPVSYKDVLGEDFSKYNLSEKPLRQTIVDWYDYNAQKAIALPTPGYECEVYGFAYQSDINWFSTFVIGHTRTNKAVFESLSTDCAFSSADINNFRPHDWNYLEEDINFKKKFLDPSHDRRGVSTLIDDVSVNCVYFPNNRAFDVKKWVEKNWSGAKINVINGSEVSIIFENPYADIHQHMRKRTFSGDCLIYIDKQSKPYEAQSAKLSELTAKEI
jgi:hypothetical protein